MTVGEYVEDDALNPSFNTFYSQYYTLHSLIMSAPQDTYTNDIEVIVCTLADRLNAEHRNLANELSGEFQAFFVDICLKGRPAHDAAARLDTAQTLPRPSFQKILSALKQFPRASNSSNVIVDDIYHLRRFNIRPDFPNSLFHNGRVVIAHDAVIHVLHAIWNYAHVPEKTFMQVVSGTCSYVPAHVVSRYLLLVMPRRIRQPVVSKAVIGRSSFGHSVMGESYLRLMTPHPTPAFPDSAEMELLHVLPVVSLDSSSASPSASPSANSVSPLPDLSTSLTPRTAAESGTPLCTITAHLLDRISSTLCTILPGERSQRTHIPSSSIPGSSALKENVAAIDVDAEQPDSRKRKFWFSFQQDATSKRRKVNDGTSRSASVGDEAAATLDERDDVAGSSEAGAAQGLPAQRPMVKLRKARYHGCPVPWFRWSR